MLTINDVCYRLKIGRTKFYELLKRDEFPLRPVRIGDQLRFSRLEFERFCHGELAGTAKSESPVDSP